MLKKFADLHEVVKKKKQLKRLVLAVAQDDHSLEAVSLATDKKYIEPILVGDADQIKEIADNKKIDLKKFNIINEMFFIRSCNTEALNL
jgi:phosphate butyryltransferase